MKKSKYNSFVKFIAIFLTIAFAFLAGTSCLNLIRKSIFFADESKQYTSTPAFNESMSHSLSRLQSLKDNINIYRPEMTFENFKKTEYAKEEVAFWKEKEEKAIKLFDTIQELKKLKPDDQEKEKEILYYNQEDDTYYVESEDTWITYDEFLIYYDENDVIVYDWDSVDFEDENGVFTTVYDVGMIPSDEELFRLEKSYSTYKEWNEKYQQLRYAIFSIVNDATSHETIKADVEERCYNQLYSSYDNIVVETENTINKFVNISFIIRDNKTGNVIANLPKDQSYNEFINNLHSHAIYSVQFDGEKLYSPVPEKYKASNLLKFLDEIGGFSYIEFNKEYFREHFNNCTVYIKLTADLKQGDDFYNHLKSFEAVEKHSSDFYLYCVLIFAFLSVVALNAAGFMAGKMEDGSTKLSLTDKIPFVLHTVITLMLLFGIGFLITCLGVTDLFVTNGPIDDSFIWLLTSNVILTGTGILFALFSLILTNYILYIERNVKAKAFANRFLIGFTIKKLSKLKRSHYELSETVSVLRKKTIIALAGYIIINLILLIFSFTDIIVITITAMVIFNAIALAYAFKYLSDVSRLCEIAEQIKSGTFDTVIRPGSFVSPLRKFAVDLSACRDSIQSAIDNAIKGEHLKTELITNVSHDLKTPLTSIINYVSLLKMCNMQGKDANKYLDILDDKSRKLQRLIEDLTEASKATSGNIKMNLDTVNLNELALQAVGENSDVLENVGLDLVLTEKDEEIYVKADSQHTFRIIDNLFSNAKKYSLTGTRVYVDVYKKDGYGILSVKNISRDKLNITPDELTERFVRGDNSRTTDGSGLGLSIARSFAELQNGLFVIEIDGDMFRASVKLPLTNPPKKQETPQSETDEKSPSEQEAKNQI